MPRVGGSGGRSFAGAREVTAIDGGQEDELPSGVIVMWSGLLADIPQGWSLCDGLGGRPDLRDRFIMGWTDAVDPGGTGGATTHTHADHTGVINHTHPVNVTDPNHNHTQNAHVHAQRRNATATGANSGWTTAFDASSSNPANDVNTGTASTTATNVAGATGVTASSTNPAGGVATLAHGTGDHTPAYYKLAFIIQD